MKIKITIEKIQHIEKLEINLDLSENRIMCISGKNGIGKTTFIRAMRNLSINNTFQATAAPYIFSDKSKIYYEIEGLSETIEFKYNRFIRGIDTKQEIPEEIKSIIKVELPIPHGERFTHFRSLSDRDEEIRTKIAHGDYSTPSEMINFLETVYTDRTFGDIRQVGISNNQYYFILRDQKERFYIREDYFSSGEYFIINLFKQIEQGKKLIVIDEIDISLDASAQVNLVNALRDYCKEYETNIVFTTHSLALMKTLRDDELHYMEYDNEANLVATIPRSYNFVKTVMYGFYGFDRYILTEDRCLEDYIRYLLQSSEGGVFFNYKIIYIAGGSQVVDLLKRNSEYNFLCDSKSVVAVLDGDQKSERYTKNREDILFLPFDSIEKEIYQRYLDEDSPLPKVESIQGKNESRKAKNLFWKLTKTHAGQQLMSKEDVYSYLVKLNPDGVNNFRECLLGFVNPG